MGKGKPKWRKAPQPPSEAREWKPFKEKGHIEKKKKALAVKRMRSDRDDDVQDDGEYDRHEDNNNNTEKTSQKRRKTNAGPVTDVVKYNDGKPQAHDFRGLPFNAKNSVKVLCNPSRVMLFLLQQLYDDLVDVAFSKSFRIGFAKFASQAAEDKAIAKGKIPVFEDLTVQMMPRQPGRHDQQDIFILMHGHRVLVGFLRQQLSKTVEGVERVVAIDQAGFRLVFILPVQAQKVKEAKQIEFLGMNLPIQAE